MKRLVIKQKNFDADYAGVGYLDMVKAQIYDERLLSDISPDLEGAYEVTLIDGDESESFIGYIELIRIERIDEERVCFLLARPKDDTAE